MLLALFCLQVTPVKPTKFRVNSPFGSGEVKKKDFQDGHYGGHLGFPIRTILANVDLQVTLILPIKFQVSGRFFYFSSGGHFIDRSGNILAVVENHLGNIPVV